MEIQRLKIETKPINQKDLENSVKDAKKNNCM